MAESQKRKNRSSNSSKDSESSSPADKKKKNHSSVDEDEVFMESNMAADVSESIQQILHKVQKLDNVEALLNKALAKLDMLETRVNQLDIKFETLDSKLRVQEKTIGDFTASTDFLSKKFEEGKQYHEETKNTIKSQGLEINRLRKDLLYLESYSRRENLIISGLPEEQDETAVQTLAILQNFMDNELDVEDANQIQFQRVHRLGKPNSRRPRAIIARFLKYPDKERILSRGRNLRDKDIFMFSDYPETIQQSRRRQLKKLKEAKENGKTAYFSKSKPDLLYIDGHLIPE